MMIFIFDFDETITSEHTHNMITDVINAEIEAFGESKTKYDIERQWNLIKNINPIFASIAWRELFTNIPAAGHHIAIASHGTYGSHLIPRYLKEVLNLPADLVDKIQIESWLPPKDRLNKNQHIENVIRNYSGYNQVILIDDSIDNLKSAEEKGYSVVQATTDGAHIEICKKALNSFNSTNQQQFVHYTNVFQERSSSSQIGFYLLNNLSGITDFSALKNAFLVTANYELYEIDANGNTNKVAVEASKIEAFIKQLYVGSTIFASANKPVSIGALINDKAMLAFNRIFIPDYAVTETEIPQPSSADEQAIKVIINRPNRKSIEINLTQTTTLTDIKQKFETLTPYNAADFNFMLNGEKINFFDRTHATFYEYLQAIYKSPILPGEITIDLEEKRNAMHFDYGNKGGGEKGQDSGDNPGLKK